MDFNIRNDRMSLTFTSMDEKQVSVNLHKLA
jgi:hypothetical protein